jgi:hypothetical protein
MIVLRSIFASAVMVATVASAMGSATSPASASPVDESTEGVGCQYTLTPPELVLLPGGGKAVRATLDPITCAPSAQPTGVTVCVRPPHNQGNCKRLPGWQKVEVLIPATPANGTFTATGEGCWHEITRSFLPACRTTGPVSSTF